MFVSLDKSPRVLGMEPLNWLKLKSKFASWAKLPRELGMVPVSLPIARNSVCSFHMTEMLGGMVQGKVESLNDTWNLVTSPRLLIAGKVPSRSRL